MNYVLDLGAPLQDTRYQTSSISSCDVTSKLWTIANDVVVLPLLQHIVYYFRSGVSGPRYIQHMSSIRKLNFWHFIIFSQYDRWGVAKG